MLNTRHLRAARQAGLIAFGLMLAGCVNVPPAESARLDAARARYETIAPGMTRTEVFAALGMPQKQASPHQLRWETRLGFWNTEALVVGFDDADRVRSFHRSSRAVGRTVTRP